MKIIAPVAVLIATATLTSCAAAVAPSLQSRSVATSGSVVVEPDVEASDPFGEKGSGAGPLRLDDAGGKGCASLRFGREYTAWEHILEPTADVTLAGWSLVGAENVTVGRGFVAQLPRRVGATGFTLGFPPEDDAVGARTVDWEGRRPAAGAELKAGTRHNLWLQIEVVDDVRRAAYRGLRLHYTSGGQEFTAVSDVRMRFRQRCA